MPHDGTVDAPPRLDRSACIVTATALVLYLIIAAEKPVAIAYTRVGDPFLFLSQALDIIRGNWLGPYWTNTLREGPGVSAVPGPEPHRRSARWGWDRRSSTSVPSSTPPGR